MEWMLRTDVLLTAVIGLAALVVILSLFLIAILRRYEDGVEMISRERERQLYDYGFSTMDDLSYTNNELVLAAICYATPPAARELDPETYAPKRWPWHARWWKPKDRERDLVRAGALIAAELDRLQMAHWRHEQKRQAAAARA